MTKAQKQERAGAIEKLRGILKPGDTVNVILRSVSRSGMSRKITPMLVDKDGGTVYLGYLASTVLGLKVDDHAVTMGGCGMDMGFALVYELSHALWPEGYGCTGEGCRSNDHSNRDWDYTPHSDEVRVCVRCDYAGPCTTCPRCVRPTKDSTPRHEHWHPDGGYALRHRWL